MESLKNKIVPLSLVGSVALSGCAVESDSQFIGFSSPERLKYEITETCAETIVNESVEFEENFIALDQIDPLLLQQPDAPRLEIRERTNSKTLMDQEAGPTSLENFAKMIEVYSGFRVIDEHKIEGTNLNVVLKSDAELPFSAEKLAEVMMFPLLQRDKMRNLEAHKFLWCLNDSIENSSEEEIDINILIAGDPQLCFQDLGLARRSESGCKFTGFAPPPIKIDSLIRLEMGRNIYIAPGLKGVDNWSDIAGNSGAERKFYSTLIHESLHTFEWISGGSISVKQNEDTVYETTDHVMFVNYYDHRASLPPLIDED